MNKVQILDCTLRDGGYINQWKFGKEIIRKTVDSLIKTGIDIIELGFLTQLESFNENVTLFPSIKDVTNIIMHRDSSTTFVLSLI